MRNRFLKGFFTPEILKNDEDRFRAQFIIITFILGIVAVVMTCINLFMHEGFLTLATFLFSICSFLDMVLFILVTTRKWIPKIVFAFMVIVLYVYFLISGSPEGFSIIWILLLPSCGMLVYGRKSGTIFSLVMFGIIFFLLSTPVGYSFVRYDYSMAFKTRFPLAYAAFFAIGYFIEYVREQTYKMLVDLQKRYQFLYRHDALTGVYNRHGFNELLDRTIKVFHEDQTLTLMILDIDYFKLINDNYGHLTGDKVLIKLAQVITDVVGQRGVVSRWGGEEFAVLLHGTDTFISVTELAEAIRKRIQNTPVSADGTDLNITVSIGVVFNDSVNGLQPARLVNTADACLYEAKKQGRNRCNCLKLDDVGQ
ncbi:MAG TPA: GGDEF domain-containing protein [Thermotogota bacterium]|nr:GGDEF domain-containing protein [Thermotogota bacterium]HPJ88435.1 GGDEF domain-containing protein [Thermotogota bacterium]HPR95398.1 GGDEF domain-containing protein [Thermotogota bacterium]